MYCAAGLARITVEQLVLCREEIDARLDCMRRQRMANMNPGGAIYTGQRDAGCHSSKECAVESGMIPHAIKCCECILYLRPNEFFPLRCFSTRSRIS